MATPLPIDVAQIAWTNGTVTRFEVTGRQGAKQLLKDDPTAGIAVAHRAEVSHDEQAGEVEVFLDLGIQLTTGKSAKPVGINGRFELEFTFTVGNLAELLLTTDQPTAQLHPQLLLLLLSVAYSTARGILWTRLAGTPLEGITLPLINPSQLLPPTAGFPVPAPPQKRRPATPSRPQKPKPTV